MCVADYPVAVATASQVIASIFEFLGAMLLGGQVTKTIAGGIAKTSTFAKFPALFAFGEACGAP